MELNSYFTDFLSKIRPTEAQTKELQEAHTRLRKRLLADEYLGPMIVSVFLQGSYRRATSIRPQGDDKLDVDLVAVTRFRRQDYPVADDVMNEFTSFLNKHYKGKWKKKGRSIGIEMSDVKLDLVIASAPSEEEAWSSNFIQGYFTPDDWPMDSDPLPDHLADFFKEDNKEEPKWKLEPLYIPDRDTHQWQRTHPLEQYRWTTNKNRRTNGHYVNIVRLVKWWWRTAHPELEYPKSYPLEHLVGDCCPDDVGTLARGFTLVLEEMVSRYSAYAASGMVPFVPDRGVPEHNVLKRLSPSDFSKFVDRVQQASADARKALDSDDPSDSAMLWQSLFGKRFPSPPSGSAAATAGAAAAGTGVYTPRQERTRVGGGRFA